LTPGAVAPVPLAYDFGGGELWLHGLGQHGQRSEYHCEQDRGGPWPNAGSHDYVLLAPRVGGFLLHYDA
jgi:hypothetical protein